MTESRNTTSDGSTIIYSPAYLAIEAYRGATLAMTSAQEDLADAQRHLAAKQARMDIAQAAMIEALTAHYGEAGLPEAIDFAGTTLLFERIDDGIEVRTIKAHSYCDLYRIEKNPKVAPVIIAEPISLYHEPEAA